MTLRTSCLPCCILILLIAFTSCKPDTSKEGFAGVNLGGPFRTYVRSLKEPKFKSYEGYSYYTFNTHAGKPFYARVYCGYNNDSIVLYQDIYITQNIREIPTLGKDMWRGKVGVDYNLVANKDRDVPQPDEIYMFLKNGFSSKYKLQSDSTVDILSTRVITTVYRKDDDMDIALYRFKDMNPFQFEGVIPPTDCIKITYQLTDKFIKKNHLDNYKSRTQDL